MPTSYSSSGRWWEAIDLFFDKRSLVRSPSSYPWSVHGYVEASFPEKGFHKRGTGTLVDKSTVLTAAHCFYHKELDASGKYVYTPATEITFYSGMQAGRYTWNGKAIKTMVHPEYLNNDENFDFGVIQLDEKIGERYGWASIVALDDVDLFSLNVNVTGYPGYKGAIDFLRKKASYDMYTMSGKIEVVDKHIIRYFIDTSGGQSGGVVWALNSEEIIEGYGIHVSGAKIEGNRAIRINAENFIVLNDWISKFEQ